MKLCYLLDTSAMPIELVGSETEKKEANLMNALFKQRNELFKQRLERLKKRRHHF